MGSRRHPPSPQPAILGWPPLTSALFQKRPLLQGAGSRRDTRPVHGLWSPAPLRGLGPHPRLLRASASFGKRGDDNRHPLLLVEGGACKALRTVPGTQ